jgi:hypothetical protein
MAAAIASTSLVPVQPAFTDAERLALAGYLAGYRGLTREAYTHLRRPAPGAAVGPRLPGLRLRAPDAGARVLPQNRLGGPRTM